MKILSVQPFSVQIFTKYFSLTWILENICCCFSKSLFNWSPHFITSFSKAVKIQTDSCTAEMGFQLVPKYLKESETAKICSHTAVVDRKDSTSGHSNARWDGCRNNALRLKVKTSFGSVRLCENSFGRLGLCENSFGSGTV